MQQLAYLITNGVIDIEFIQQQIPINPNIYVCDGAYNKIHNLLPINTVIGDLDSIISLPNSTNYHQINNQDTTDLAKAIKWLIPKYQAIKIYGADGKDLDHFLSNLSIAINYQAEIDITFYSKHQIIKPFINNISYPISKNSNISIIPAPTITVNTSHGLQYPLDNMQLTFGKSISVRNVAIADSLEIIGTGAGLLIIGSNQEF